MNLKVFNSLKKIENKELNEFLNILHYTFLLDSDRILMGTTDAFVNEAEDKKQKDREISVEDMLKKTLEIIKPFFASGGVNYMGLSVSQDGPSRGNQDFCGLQFSDEIWKNSVMYHCAIAALFNIEAVLFEWKTDTVYNLCNYVKGQGLLDTIFNRRCNQNKNEGNDYSNTANLFGSRVGTLYENFTDNERKILLHSYREDKDNKTKKRTLPLLYEDIVYRLVEQGGAYDTEEPDTNKKNLINMFHKIYAEGLKGRVFNGQRIKDYDQFFGMIMSEVQSELYKFDYKAADNFQKADYIIYLYKLESFYNLSSVKTLFDAIYRHNYEIDKSGGDKRLNGEHIVNSLMPLLDIPAVFSRDIIIRYVFESFYNRFDSNYFEERNRSNNTVVSFIDSQPDLINRVDEWLILLQKFCRYFNNLVFPLAEGVFMSMLIQNFDFESESKDGNTEISIGRGNKTTVALSKDTYRCLELLANFIGENFDKILQPQSFSGRYVTPFASKISMTSGGGELKNIIVDDMKYFSGESSKEELRFYNEIINQILQMQGNLLHPNGKEEKKKIKIEDIRIKDEQNNLRHKQLATLLINEAIGRA